MKQEIRLQVSDNEVLLLQQVENDQYVGINTSLASGLRRERLGFVKQEELASAILGWVFCDDKSLAREELQDLYQLLVHVTNNTSGVFDNDQEQEKYRLLVKKMETILTMNVAKEVS